MPDELKEVLAEIKAYMELERESGVEEYFLKGLVKAARPDYVPPEDLRSLKEEVMKCSNCDES